MSKGMGWMGVARYALIAVAVILAAAGGPATAAGDDKPFVSQRRIVIAHRGASGYLPEHTLPAYALAYAQGADFIEPDVVMTRDQELIALHDIHLERTTDAEQRFPNRARDDGRWYAADFDLAEIKLLAVHERVGRDGRPVFPGRFRSDSRGFQVPTLREVIELVQELNRISGCVVGLYPETKDPPFHDAQGLPLEEALLKLLAEYGYKGRSDPVIVQSFDAANLREMRESLGTDLKLVQLIGGGPRFDALATGAGLDAVAAYADGIGPSKSRIEDAEGKSVEGNALVRAAHARGLFVHTYTVRADRPQPADGNLEDELRRLFDRYGVDGVFTDHTDRAVAVRDEVMQPESVRTTRRCPR